MADTVQTRVLANGPRNIVLELTNFSDGTGESGVTKLDATSATYAYKGVTPGVYLKVMQIDAIVRSGGVRLLWDATTDEDLAVLNGEFHQSWKKHGGLKCPAITGATGSILLTTVGFMPNSGYNITLHCTKNVPQS